MRYRSVLVRKIKAVPLTAGEAMKPPVTNQVVNPPSRFERWFELDQRIGPQQTAFQFAVHVIVKTLIPDANKAADIGRIVLHQAMAEIEDIQGDLPAPYNNKCAAESK